MLEKFLYSHVTLGTIARVIGAELPEGLRGGVRVGRVLTQPLYVSEGDVVISGWYPRTKTVAEALERGAAAVFCSKEVKASFPQEKVIAVDDPFRCVCLYEQWRTKHCPAKRVVITGSVGKTTTTGLISAVLSASFKTFTSQSMANSHDAVLRNVQLLERSHQYWVQEIGGVHPGYIESSAVFLQPDIVVLTNIGDSHLDLYGTRENILWDKASLERHAKPGAAVIINADDALLSRAAFTHRVIRCSLYDPAADYYADGLQTTLDGLRFTVHFDGESRDVRLHLYGEHNAYNALSAFAVGRLAGLAPERIIRALESYHTDGMRQNLVRIGGYTLFVDAFNAEPKTVLGAAQTLAAMPVEEGGRRIFVTGHIDKLGKDSAEKHAALGRELAKLDLDLVLLFAGDSRYTYEAMKALGCRNALLMSSRDELEDWLEQNITRKDLVFFKSGQFKASLGRSVDHVFGTAFQNELQWNDGRLVEEDGFVFRVHKDQFAELEACQGKAAAVTVPDHVGDSRVTRIAPRAFAGNTRLETVILPDSVRNIGREAFLGCRRLREARLSARLKIIEDGAFSGCRALERIEIPAGTIHIGDRAFSGCAALPGLPLPASVGYVGENALPASSHRAV